MSEADSAARDAEKEKEILDELEQLGFIKFGDESRKAFVRAYCKDCVKRAPDVGKRQKGFCKGMSQIIKHAASHNRYPKNTVAIGPRADVSSTVRRSPRLKNPPVLHAGNASCSVATAPVRPLPRTFIGRPSSVNIREQPAPIQADSGVEAAAAPMFGVASSLPNPFHTGQASFPAHTARISTSVPRITASTDAFPVKSNPRPHRGARYGSGGWLQNHAHEPCKPSSLTTLQITAALAQLRIDGATQGMVENVARLIYKILESVPAEAKPRPQGSRLCTPTSLHLIEQTLGVPPHEDYVIGLCPECGKICPRNTIKYVPSTRDEQVKCCADTVCSRCGHELVKVCQ